jgi:hypothetical protein
MVELVDEWFGVGLYASVLSTYTLAANLDKDDPVGSGALVYFCFGLVWYTLLSNGLTGLHGTAQRQACGIGFGAY